MNTQSFPNEALSEQEKAKVRHVMNFAHAQFQICCFDEGYAAALASRSVEIPSETPRFVCRNPEHANEFGRCNLGQWCDDPTRLSADHPAAEQTTKPTPIEHGGLRVCMKRALSFALDGVALVVVFLLAFGCVAATCAALRDPWVQGALLLVGSAALAVWSLYRFYALTKRLTERRPQ